MVEFNASTPFEEQLGVMASTGVLVSVHTSNLANSQFLQPGSAVVELLQRNWLWHNLDKSFQVSREGRGQAPALVIGGWTLKGKASNSRQLCPAVMLAAGRGARLRSATAGSTFGAITCTVQVISLDLHLLTRCSRQCHWYGLHRMFKPACLVRLQVQTEVMGDIHHYAWRARHRNQTVYINKRDGERFGNWTYSQCAVFSLLLPCWAGQSA